jgi:hypothetical protein
VLSAGEVKQVCQPAVYRTVAQQVMVSPGTQHWVRVQQTAPAMAYQPVQYSVPPMQRPAPYAPARQPYMQYPAPLK